jgi:hypothetical protein
MSSQLRLSAFEATAVQKPKVFGMLELPQSFSSISVGYCLSIFKVERTKLSGGNDAMNFCPWCGRPLIQSGFIPEDDGTVTWQIDCGAHSAWLNVTGFDTLEHLSE